MNKKNISTLFLFLLCFLTARGQEMFVSSVAPAGASYLRLADGAPAVLNFIEGSSARPLSVESNLAYTASAAADWCMPSQLSGMEVSVEQNSDAAIRTTQLTLQAKDNQRLVVEVNQLGTDPGILVRESQIALTNDALTFSVEVTTNTSVSFSCPEWVTPVDATPVTGIRSYTFRAEALPEAGERSGQLVIEGEGVSEAVTVALTQTYAGAPRFAVISDIHFGNSTGQGPMVKVPRALRNLLAKTPRIDALFIAGDLTNYGQSDQYDQLLTVFNDTAIVPADLPVYFLMGNHDHYSGDAAYTNYYKLGQPLHQYVDIKGYPFITISMSGTSSNSYDESCLQYLREKLADAAANYPGKPIFVFTHVPPLNTCYGSTSGQGGWGTDRFETILAAYPQVVIFSGHSHFPLGDPRSIYQENYTAVNDGSTTYSEVEPGVVNEGIHPEGYEDITEGLIVTVDDASNIEMERWDTYRDEEILPRWYVRAPHDGSAFLYKGRTGGESPAFAAGDSVRVTDVQEECCTVTFPPATDDEVVHHYIVEIVQNGEAVVSNSRFSGYYLNSDMPLSYTVKFDGVPTDATLTARVTAIDSYDNASEPLVSAPFVTSPYQPAEGTSKPVADLFDIVFGADGSATDLTSNVTVVPGSTTPATYLNETYGLWTASFSGSGACHYRVDYADNAAIKSAFQNGFTYEVFYKPNDTDNVCPMSAQESGGAGVEQADGGLIQFYAHIGGSYKVLKSSVTAKSGNYYHVVAVYDKDAAKTRIYVNGSPAGEMDTEGSFGFPSNTAAHWIAIGGDASGSANAQYALDGEVMVARMYGKPVSRDEVYWMYKELRDRRDNYQPSAGSSKPEADLFDIQFGADGAATDVSPRAISVTAGPTVPETYENTTFGRWAAKFPGDGSTYYKVDYSNDEAIKAAFQNGFAFEVVYLTNNTNNVCPMSAQESGGAGIEQASGGQIQFYARYGGSYKILRSSVTAATERYYHVIATYDAAAQQTRMYVNGEPVGTADAAGSFGFPSSTDAQWIAIGGDAHGGTSAQYALNGEVVVARMYGKTLNRDDAYWLYRDLTGEAR